VNQKIDNYFLNISSEDIKNHKKIVRNIRKNRDELLRRESKKIKELL